MSEKILLGFGHYGKVYFQKIFGKDYAVKYILGEIFRPSFITEISTLLYLKGTQGVLQIETFYLRQQNKIVVTELADGSLKDFIVGDKLQTISRQLVEALYNIHMKGVTHNDIRLDNILYSDNPFRVFYGDFGISDMEISDAGFKMDISDLGSTLVKLVLEDPSNKHVYSKNLSYEQLWEEQYKNILKRTSEEFVRFLRKIYVPYPLKPLDLDLLLKDEYLQIGKSFPRVNIRARLDKRVFNFNEETQNQQKRVKHVNYLMDRIRNIPSFFIGLCYYDLLTQGRRISDSKLLIIGCGYLALCIKGKIIEEEEFFKTLESFFRLSKTEIFYGDFLDKTILALDKYSYTATSYDYLILSDREDAVEYLICLELPYENRYFHPKSICDAAIFLMDRNNKISKETERILGNFENFYRKSDITLRRNLVRFGISQDHIENIVK